MFPLYFCRIGLFFHLLFQIIRLILNLQVAERALFLWNNDHIENLIKQNHKIILPIVLPALERNARDHWNQAVRSLTINVCKIFSDTDPEFYEKCKVKFQEDEAQEKDLKSMREARWKRLEEMGGMKAATNEPVLVSPRTASHGASGKQSRAQLEWSLMFGISRSKSMRIQGVIMVAFCCFPLPLDKL